MLGLVLLAGCRVEVGAPGTRAASGPAEVWVYTSMYQEVVDAMDPAVEKATGARVEWFQAGSEKVAQRWEAEDEAGGSRACVVATSDPLWYVDLAARGKLAAYVSPRALDLPRVWVAPEYAAMRVSEMTIAAVGEAPPSFRALGEPEWRGKFSTPDPLSSGTTFTALSVLEARYGADWLVALKTNGWVAAGGNSAVLARMESGEKPVGMILRENLKDTVTERVPEEGRIPVPGFVAIPAACPSREAAERVVDWFLGEEAQARVVGAKMASPFGYEGAVDVRGLAEGAEDRRARLQGVLR
jgi:iron(III) transport system substrate-binding protein